MFTDKQNKAYQRARYDYAEIQRKKAELPERDRRLIETAETLDVGRYGVSSSIVLMVADVYSNNAMNAFCTIFSLGFIKGQRSERNKRKRG